MTEHNTQHPSSGLTVCITAGDVYLKFTPLTGPRAMLNIEAFITACGYAVRSEVQTAIIAWCREQKISHGINVLMEGE